MNNKQFFEANYRDKQNKYLQADGNVQEENSWQQKWAGNNDGGDWYSGNKNWLGADSGQGDSQGPSTYIIKIVNSCSSAISNVDIGDAANNRSVTADASRGTDTGGAFNSNTNITLSCPVSDISYGEFLASTESQPFTVGCTVIISTTAGQLDNAITVTHRNVGGKREDFVITPTLDRFQNQTDRILDETEYIFDGMTRLRLSSVLGDPLGGSAAVTIRMYTKNKYSATQIIAGRGAESNYSAPNFIK